ncbi:MAG: insulinase family protein, partial [Proteobacteria bacterium]|nr:insulinase family protein [Pseudomonadota bacterium]
MKGYIMSRPSLLIAASVAALALPFLSIGPALSAEQPTVAAEAKIANTKAWVQSKSDIPADPRVRFGILPNGMQYALLRNATPPDQVVFRLAMDAGSLMEQDDQRGLAHFMEHMAFSGSESLPGSDMIELLERRGLAFGRDVNASTGFDQTVYMLSLPNADDAVVDDSLRVMLAQVSSAALKPEAIDRECPPSAPMA